MTSSFKSSVPDETTENTPLISSHDDSQSGIGNAQSIIAPCAPINNQTLNINPVRERLQYDEYATIDWLQDLVQHSQRRTHFLPRPKQGIRDRIYDLWDSTQGWIAAFMIGLLTAAVAAVVDLSVETVADWKDGYCTRNMWLSHRACCAFEENCQDWRLWSTSFGPSYIAYVSLSLAFGIFAGSVTMTTRKTFGDMDPAINTSDGQSQAPRKGAGKSMYMAAGSGIPEIKTVLSGFVIPHLFDLKVLVVKAVGATFAVATGMCLGKEGPFVHISACVGYLVAMRIPKYATNERKLREMLSVACSAGLSVAFGAPIGGVLFSFEEISTYFPRSVLWRSCLCSVVAAAVLKALNPTGTGKLVLFETNYGVDYDIAHYLIFILLGICGGVFGGVFCRANFSWSQSFRKLSLINRNPVFEVALVTLITALLQYPNPLIRETGDIVMQRLLVDCNNLEEDWICQQEALVTGKGSYYAWLISGTFVKLLLTTITFGCKVPSGIIIPAMDAGALFGRMIGQVVPNISPGIFAMVGSAAFLAGVSRMTVSLAVIMFELTGEVNFIPPFIIAILTAKWVADSITPEGVYDLAQRIQGHPFFDSDQALNQARDLRVSKESATVDMLVLPESIIEHITVIMSANHKVIISTLRTKLARLKSGSMTEEGLILLNDEGLLHGYISQFNVETSLQIAQKSEEWGGMSELSVFDHPLAEHIDRTPMCVFTTTPLEIAIELFGKLGVDYLIVVKQGTAKVQGIITKKGLLRFLDMLKHNGRKKKT
ncbi:chloride channel [Mariannaea sp. PMI_226]|nr:chloride channel [Mariannaea sp. PMI_226]